jgi:membrane dipeptidase
MKAAEPHCDLTVFDRLIVANFGRGVFEHMPRGGLTGANCTCCIWEGFRVFEVVPIAG